jgi:hypothetical protein
VNAGTIITRLLPQLHASVEANLVATSRAELLKLIDESVKRLARISLIFTKRHTAQNTAAATATYALPSDHLATLHLSVADVPMIASSSTELEMLGEAYKETPGTPEHWYGDGDGLETFGLYPVPTGTATIAKVYQSLPAAITDPSGLTVTMPEVFDDYIHLRTLRETYTKESDIAMPELAQPLDKLLGLYELAAVELYGRGQ